MAKRKDVVPKYTYPSRFGSHASMILKEEGDVVTCQDEFGEYTTSRSRIDNGLVDPARCAQNRLGKLFQGKKEKN